MVDLLHSFYRDRNVFVTGHSGFKGSWLSLWLKQLGAKVHGYSLPAPTHPSLYEIFSQHALAGETIADIRNAASLVDAVKAARPDIIFHLAAQPLVRRSYREPADTFEVNALGTVNLLEAARQAAPEATVVVITTDKCYENVGWPYGYRENDPLGGHDVYSMSKAAAELVVQSWRKSFHESLGPLASARAGNVIGGGDYGEDRIIPDLVRAQLAGEPLKVRRPQATRPWQHVLDCLSGYLVLATKLAQQGRTSELASAFNFGPAAESQRTVKDLVDTFTQHWPCPWQIEADANAPHESHHLHLVIDKAAQLLHWRPVWNFSEAVQQTALWYRAHHVTKEKDLLGFSLAQIGNYSDEARAMASTWGDSA